MKKLWIILMGITIIQSYAHSQNINNYHKPNLTNDSLFISKLIDSVFEHRAENMENAVKLANIAFNKSKNIKNITLQTGSLNLLGSVYSDLGEYQKAVKLYYQALKLAEKNNNFQSIATMMSNIGRVYMEMGKLDDAVKYLNKGKDLAEAKNLNKQLVLLYSNLTNTYIRLNQLDKALVYGLKSDSLNKAFNMKSIQAKNDGNIGALYYYKKEPVLAMKYFNLSKKLALAAKDSINYYKQVVNIAEVSYEYDPKTNPLPSYLEALDYFLKIKDLGDIQYTGNDLSLYYQSKGNYQLALKYYQQSVAANNKNINLQSQKNVAALQTQYETEKKEQELNILHKENIIQKLSITGRNRTIAIIIALFLLSGVFVALFYNRNQLKQKNLLQAQNLAQREYLTKAVIDAEEKERQRIASDLHDGVGQLFTAVKLNLSGLFNRIQINKDEDRFLAEQTLALVDESCKEVRTISHQMMPNMLLRSGIASDVKSFIEKIDSKSLKITVETTGFKNKLESNVEIVLYRVIQETVNNVIKHAKAATLSIKLTREEGKITAIITDNGVGFNTELRNDFDGIGLKNVFARINYLKGEVKYLSSPDSGTTVSISVPLI